MDAGRQGLDAFVLRVDDDRQGGEIVLTEPPVIATCVGTGLPEGKRVSATLIEVDVITRSVAFGLAHPT